MFVQALIAFLLALILGVTVRIAITIQRLLEQTERANSSLSETVRTLRESRVQGPVYAHFVSSQFDPWMLNHRAVGTPDGWVLWVWRDNTWHCESSIGEADAGPPPISPGWFEGDRRRVRASRSR